MVVDVVGVVVVVIVVPTGFGGEVVHLQGWTSCRTPKHASLVDIPPQLDGGPGRPDGTSGSQRALKVVAGAAVDSSVAGGVQTPPSGFGATTQVPPFLVQSAVF